MSLEEFLKEHNNTISLQMFGSKILETKCPDTAKFEMCLDIVNRHYRFIGTLENFACVDTWLARAFNCRPVKAHDNQNYYDSMVSPQVLDDFRSRNTIDYMLYYQVGRYWENSKL